MTFLSLKASKLLTNLILSDHLELISHSHFEHAFTRNIKHSVTLSQNFLQKTLCIIYHNPPSNSSSFCCNHLILTNLNLLPHVLFLFLFMNHHILTRVTLLIIECISQVFNTWSIVDSFLIETIIFFNKLL